MKISTIPTEKQSIIDGLNEVYDLVTKEIENLDQTQFNHRLEDKWSIAENLQHLILGSFPIASGLKSNKLMLRALGKPFDAGLSYSGLLANYQEALADGRARSTPKYTPKETVFDKTELLSNWTSIKHKLVDRLDEKWREKDLDKFTFPHPILGKLSVRQILYFTIFHTLHHLQAINTIINHD